jgi:hypothetical protein
MAHRVMAIVMEHRVGLLTKTKRSINVATLNCH